MWSEEKSRHAPADCSSLPDSMRGLLVLLGVLLALLAGCRQMAANSQMKAYAALLDPKVGKANKADVIRDLGMPERCEPAAGHEFCRFRTSYGQRATATANGGVAHATAYESYDQIDAEFDGSGMFMSWRAYVQR